MGAAQVRKVNLIEILADDEPDVPEPPEYAYKLWSEEQIRGYFESMGIADGLPTPEAAAPAGPPPLTPAEIHAKFPVPDPELFKKWFPGLQRSKTECAAPKMRLICWTNAGNEENLYTNEGAGARRVANLLEFCRANQVEILAPQLPGRGMRRGDPFITKTQDVAKAVLPLLAPKIADVPYCVVGHSVGTWNSFEMLSLFREQGLPMPKKCFFSNFPGPQVPVADRPWKPCRGMEKDAFREESLGWDVNEIVFSDGMWNQFKDIMYNDFHLFDEYEHGRADDAPFDFPLTTFFATHDKKVKKHHVELWQRWTSKEYKINEIDGHHLYAMGLDAQKPAKEKWLDTIVAELKELL